jgi:hypothetical protein
LLKGIFWEYGLSPAGLHLSAPAGPGVSGEHASCQQAEPIPSKLDGILQMAVNKIVRQKDQRE